MSSTGGVALVGLAALVVGGMYLFDRVTGKSKATNPLKYLVAWGAGFLILSLLASVVPTIAGGLALMIIVVVIGKKFGAVNQGVEKLVKQAPQTGNPELQTEQKAASKVLSGLHSSTIINSAVRPFQTGF